MSNKITEAKLYDALNGTREYPIRKIQWARGFSHSMCKQIIAEVRGNYTDEIY